MQPSSTGACLSDLLSLDLHWFNTDVCVVYSTRHLPAEYLLHHMDHDFGICNDCYINALQGKNYITILNRTFDGRKKYHLRYDTCAMKGSYTLEHIATSHSPSPYTDPRVFEYSSQFFHRKLC